MRNRGFSIIELIVAVIIVGILASIAVPIYTNLVQSSRRSEAYATIGGIRSAMDAYYTEYNTYPHSIQFQYQSNQPYPDGNESGWGAIGMENLSKPSNSGWWYGVYVIYSGSPPQLWYYIEARNTGTVTPSSVFWYSLTKNFTPDSPFQSGEIQ